MAEGPSPSGHSLYREIRCNEVPYNESHLYMCMAAVAKAILRFQKFENM
jgi:hypothetical protein